ncbi:MULTISPECIES: hypothetical protein [Pseudonocardia]|uniref:hypothetical protein n=1 Tax=Pseudonocardia TaxID=1847 RepID=UPI000F7A5D2B|nr:MULTISPECIES: hypothetical protein [Pseudonocardia]
MEHERLVVPVLLDRPEWLDATEIARSAGLAVTAVRTVLVRMVRRGLVISRRQRVRRRPSAGRAEFRLTERGAPMTRLLIGCAATMTAAVLR